MHLLDKRSTRALPVAAMIHDNSTDRTALVPATHHSNFCPINFRWCAPVYSSHSVGRCAPGLNWPGRASGAVTLKKLECSKQAYALLLTSYVEVSLHGQLLRGTMAFQATKFEAITVSRESSARVDYVPALCTHRPSLPLPIEWSGEVLGSRRRGRFAAGDVARIPLNLNHLEEGEVVTRFRR
ncbi:hypothetical protein L1887_45932 [Cichorium endivia]|nr:hypothetical protein L1887_45932 [Cichorium endivia]